MDRNILKQIAIGQYILTNRGQTFEQSKIDLFVDGALFVFDLLQKQQEEKKKGKQNDTTETSGINRET